MGAVLKLVFVALVAALFAGCVAGVVVTAFGWPLWIAAVLAGMGGGAAAARGYRRIQAHAAGL